MHKYQLLRKRAEEFRSRLEERAKVDSDVEAFLMLWMPWYERIQRREIRLPCYEYRMGAYFENPDVSPLAEKYSYVTPQHPVARASTGLSEAMRDWLSDPLYIEKIRATGKEPSAILDEEPPPEEETLLVSDQASASPSNWLQKLLVRWKNIRREKTKTKPD